MAKVSGLDEALYINAYDLSGDVGASQSLKKIIGEQDTTGLDKHAHERLMLLQDGEIVFANYFNDGVGVDSLHEVLSGVGAGLPATDRVVSHFMGREVGDPTANLQGKQINYDLERGSDGALNGGAITCKSNKFGLEWGYALSDGKVEELHNAVTTGVSTIDVVQASKRYTRVGGTSFLTLGFQVGDSVTIAGYVDGASNGVKNIVAVTSTYFEVAEVIGVNEAGTGNEQVDKTTGSEDGLDGTHEGFATGSDGTLVVYFHIFEIVGGAGDDVEIFIEDSDDDGAADPYSIVTVGADATTGVVDESAAPFTLRLEVAGPVKKWIRATVKTADGYTSCKFAVSVVRNGPPT